MHVAAVPRQQKLPTRVKICAARWCAHRAGFDWKATGWLGIITAGALWTALYGNTVDEGATAVDKLILQIQRTVDECGSDFQEDDAGFLYGQS